MSSEHESGPFGVTDLVSDGEARERFWFGLRATLLRSNPVLKTVRWVLDHDRILVTGEAGLGIGWMVIFLVAPILYIVTLSFWKSAGAGVIVHQFTLANYQAVLTKDVDLLSLHVGNLYLNILWQSLKYGFLVTLVTLVVGYVPAYYLGRVVSRWKALLLLFVVLPFWVPLIIRYYAWILVLGNKGMLPTMLSVAGIQNDGFLYTEVAVITGLVQVLLPYMILPVYNSVEQMDASLIESAKTMGAGPVRTFYEVTLPLTLPGISAGVLLVFILSVGSFMAPALLGGPSNFMVANLIDMTFGSPNWPLAGAMGVVYLVVLFGAISLFNRFVSLDEVFGE